ncbi:hypothetical protein A11A3_13113 [Alcanivorax hongdengensis A-11-3]|uniref:START domain-containing protein n=1 Tax=Alcanivorax hongdengensis A-11-3 TaxID=1177179 RepID=L0WCU8_9GAMM|nr:hypothetical protein [Alcanivorax hongdengensis]EKF73570.1 hypothetical protein A11A3_13113 [Alcanivorax hongdengensis A-11-3]
MTIKTLLLLSACLWSLAAHADRALLPDSVTWTKVTDRDGIEVYRADNHSRIETFRGKARIAIKDFNAVGALLDDYEAMADVLHMVSAIHNVKRESPFVRDVYITTQLPWPVNDRDAPLRVTFYQEPDTMALVMPFHINQDAMPEQEGYIRMPQMQGFFRFEPVMPGQMDVTLQVVLDPGGSLPAWLANIILSDIPYYSLKRLRRAVNQPRFQGIAHGYYKTPAGWQQPAGAGQAITASTASPGPAGPRESAR